MMRYLILGATFLLLQGCTNLHIGMLNLDASAGQYNPATIDSVDFSKYRADKQECFKQVQTENETSMAEHYNIIKFRGCLVKKGYVLLS